MKTISDLKASPLDDDAFRLLAIPFGGPIPHPAFPRGVDLDGDTFTERTDIKADWLPFRPTDWHHGNDQTFRRTVLGKAVDLGRFEGSSKDPDEDGWWVTVWLDHGARRLDLIKRLAEAAVTGKAAIFGSSQTVPELSHAKAYVGGGNALINLGLPANHPLARGLAREVDVWPYWRQALSTSPQNTHSVAKPLKATLDDLEAAGERPGPSFWFDLESALRSVAPSLRVPPFVAELDAKAGRVLSAANESDLKEALDALRAGLDRLDAVVRRQPDYSLKE